MVGRFFGKYNPGPYACFLSIVIPVAVYVMTESSHRLTKCAGMGMVLLGAGLIPATLSRTALAADAAMEAPLTGTGWDDVAGDGKYYSA